MEQRVPARLRKEFQGGSEDWNDVTFTGHRIRWMKEPQSGSCIEVSQKKKAIDESQKNETRKKISTAPQGQKPSGTDKLAE